MQRLPEDFSVLNDRLERPAPSRRDKRAGEEIVHAERKRSDNVNPLVLGSNPSGPTNFCREEWMPPSSIKVISETAIFCVICGASLKGRQSKFCGRLCKNRYTNYHHQSYARQQIRGRERKLQLIRMLGGKCSRCGYCRNHAALEFHHTEPGLKLFQLDMRSLANLH